MSEKLELKDVLGALDLGAREVWDELSEEQKKSVAFFLLNRYMSSVKSTNRDLQEHGRTRRALVQAQVGDGRRRGSGRPASRHRGRAKRTSRHRVRKGDGGRGSGAHRGQRAKSRRVRRHDPQPIGRVQAPRRGDRLRRWRVARPRRGEATRSRDRGHRRRTVTPVVGG